MAEPMSTLLLAVVVGLAVTILANVCTTVYLHRALAHHALTLAPPVVFVFRVLTWLTTGIRPQQWVAVHRKHHAFTGKEGDPHPAELVGLEDGPVEERGHVPPRGPQRGDGGPLRQGHQRGRLGPPAVRPLPAGA